MRVVLILTACLLAGCASGPSLERLEERALVTGDWSAVEARERSIQRRAVRVGIQCPAGFVSYCETSMATERCACINRKTLSSLMAGN